LSAQIQTKSDLFCPIAAVLTFLLFNYRTHKKMFKAALQNKELLPGSANKKKEAKHFYLDYRINGLN